MYSLPLVGALTVTSRQTHTSPHLPTVSLLMSQSHPRRITVEIQPLEIFLPNLFFSVKSILMTPSARGSSPHRQAHTRLLPSFVPCGPLLARPAESDPLCTSSSPHVSPPAGLTAFSRPPAAGSQRVALFLTRLSLLGQF